MKSSALHTEPELYRGYGKTSSRLEFWTLIFLLSPIIHLPVTCYAQWYNSPLKLHTSTTMYECHSTIYQAKCIYTVEPPNKGHLGNMFFVLSSEVVPIHHYSDIIFICTMLKILWVNVCMWWSLLVSEIVLYRVLRLTQTLLREGDKDNTLGGGITPAVEREGKGILPQI